MGYAMPSIMVDEDIYRFLLSKTERFGETESDVLRRELKLVKSGEVRNQESAFASLLSAPHFRGSTSVKAKFLLILAEAHQQKAKQFDDLLNISGRVRTHFARSYAEIANSGNNCNPKKIPNSDYWVATNNSTQQKKGLLAQALRTLGYDDASIRDAINSLEK